MTETEKAWAAGFFDGEGYINARYHRYLRRSWVYHWRRIEIQITQIHPEVLTRFKDAVGVGSIGGPYLAKGRPHGMYKYHVGGYPSVRLVLDAIYPYLSSIKKKQVDAALQWYEDSPSSYRTEVS